MKAYGKERSRMERKLCIKRDSHNELSVLAVADEQKLNSSIYIFKVPR